MEWQLAEIGLGRFSPLLAVLTLLMACPEEAMGSPITSATWKTQKHPTGGYMHFILRASVLRLAGC